MPETFPPRRRSVDAVVLGLAPMLGTGVFLVFAPAAWLAGRWLPLAIVLAGLAAACAAFADADLAARYPGSGAGYRYAREQLAPCVGRLAGLAALIGRITSAAVSALVFGNYVLPGHPIGVAVPLILVVLGANLAGCTLPKEATEEEDDPKEERNLIIASLVARMFLPTLIMAPILALLAKFAPVSIMDDPIFIVVCFLLTGAPSALQLAQICQINNVFMGAMSKLLFQSYVVW